MLFKEFCRIRRGASPRPIEEHISNVGIPWIKISDVSNGGKYINETKEFIKESSKKHSVEVQKGDLIVTNSGSPGIPKISNIYGCIHDGWLILDNFKTFVSKEYIYYWLMVNKNNLVKKGNGSIFINLKKEILENFEIDLPDRKTQDKIVEILSNIDNQIERNNCMVKRLQDLILTKYSIDFEQKMIVNGCVKDICKLPSGFSFKPEMYIDDGKYNLVTIKNVNDIFVDISKTDKLEILPKTMKDFCKLTKGDVLMSLTGNVGRISIVVEDNNLLNQRVSLFDCKEEYKTYIYALLNSQKYQIIMQKMTRGTSQKNLSPIDVEDLQIYIPNDIKEFSNVTTPIFNEMVNIQKQTNELNNLKQQLLPLLINGQIII